MVTDYQARLRARRRAKLSRDTRKRPIGIMPTLISRKLTPEEPKVELFFPIYGSVTNLMVKPFGEGEVHITFTVRNDFVANSYTYVDTREEDSKPHVPPPFVVEPGEVLEAVLDSGPAVFIGATFFADESLLTVYVDIDEVQANAKPENTGTVPSGPEE